nr:rhodanese-like domain-containing protein [Thermodesulfovibrio thiophilus]
MEGCRATQNLATLNQWEAERGDRNLYIFDVRQPEEYAKGHYQGARFAQGVQLVQATDEYAAVRNGRIVLLDNYEVRAIMTASWLNQMGYPNVYVLKDDYTKLPMTQDVHNIVSDVLTISSEKTLSAEALNDLLTKDKSAIVIDLSNSKEYAAGHIPGAYWIVRGRLPLAKDLIASASQVVLTAYDVRIAKNSLKDFKMLWPNKKVYILTGGTQTWKNAGFAVEKGLNRALCSNDDNWYKPYEDVGANPKAMHDYLTWEVGLVEKIERSGEVHFDVKCPARQTK